MHLTNYSINKTTPNFRQPGSTSNLLIHKHDDGQAAQREEREDGEQQEVGEGTAEQNSSGQSGSKWSFGQLQEHLQQSGHDWIKVWEQVSYSS